MSKSRTKWFSLDRFPALPVLGYLYLACFASSCHCDRRSM